MLQKIFILFILSISCSFAMVPSQDGEIEYDKMIREGNQLKQYTPDEIIAMQNARREANNERIRQEMENFAQSTMTSRDVKESKKKTKLDATGEKVANKVNIIIALLVVLIGGFMLLYSYSLMLRKKKT